MPPFVYLKQVYLNVLLIYIQLFDSVSVRLPRVDQILLVGIN